MDYKTQMKAWRARRQKIVRLRAQGKTLSQIAALVGATRQRIYQIVSGK